VPELPDLTIYLEHIEHRLLGERLERIRLASPFLLRTVTPTVDEVCVHRLLDTRRLGKQIVFALEDDYYLVIHLMISGRLQWGEPGAAVPRGRGLAAFDFESGCLLFTEASKKKRASLKLVRGADDLAALDPGGLEVLKADRAARDQPHAETGADRSESLRRNRQRLLGRDSPARRSLAIQAAGESE
jgi:formamidopyrimidine-DNA glycosylase